MPNPPIIQTETSFTVFLEGKLLAFTVDHPNYEKAQQAINELRWDDLSDLVDLPTRISTFAEGRLEVRGGSVFYKGEPLESYATQKLIERMDNGQSYSALINFLDKLMSNPSSECRERAYQFFEANPDMALFEDGDVLAYKREGSNPYAPATTVKNELGSTVGNRNYLTNRGARLLAVKVNPADILAVPKDHARGCLSVTCYTILAEVPE